MNTHKAKQQEAYQAALAIKQRNDGKKWNTEDAKKFEALIDIAINEKKLADASEAKEQRFNALPVHGNGVMSVRDEEDLTRFQKWADTGDSQYRITTRFHSEGNPSQGGTFVPQILQSDISKALPAFAPIRGLVRVVQAKANPYIVPRITPSGSTYDSTYQASAWVAEGAGLSDTGNLPVVTQDPQTGMLTIYLKSYLGAFVVLSREFLQDSVVDFEQVLSEVFASKLGPDMDYAYLLGDGVTQPTGILSHPSTDIAQVTIGAAAVLDIFKLVDLYSALPAQYRANATWVMNSGTLAQILKAKGTANDHPYYMRIPVKSGQRSGH
ncbi:phage major capsid protein, partial [bacterium]|nr:phage major capsid protein [bacterium]